MNITALILSAILSLPGTTSTTRVVHSDPGPARRIITQTQESACPVVYGRHRTVAIQANHVLSATPWSPWRVVRVCY